MAPHWFEAVADHLGSAYLRYSFTKGTEQEADAIVDLLGLEPGERLLDVGCGPGRHALALATRGIDVVGIDISQTFIELARAAAGPDAPARFVVGDARCLELLGPEFGTFDAVISLCQGAFGLAGGPGAELALPARELDEPILAGMASVLRPGGRLLVSAFSSYFQVQYLEDHTRFDADLGVNHEHTSVKNPAGVDAATELWTTCFTPRELRLLARLVGLVPFAVHGVTPGSYGAHPPSTQVPEFLLVATKPERC